MTNSFEQPAKSLFLFHAELEEPVPSSPCDASDHAHSHSSPDPSAYSTFLSSRPESLETRAIDLIIRCAQQFPTLRTHIVHLSAASALPTLRHARKELKLPLTVETCFHYLTLSSEQIAKGETLYKCCPPIREEINRDALWEALIAGDIDFVVSDHSPCTVELKKLEEGSFMEAWGGIGGLGLGLSLMWTEARKRGVGMERVLEWVSERPAKQVGLEGKKGGIRKGADADFVVFDPEESFTVNKDELHFKNRSSPYGAPSFLPLPLFSPFPSLSLFLFRVLIISSSSQRASHSPVPSSKPTFAAARFTTERAGSRRWGSRRESCCCRRVEEQ